MPASTILFEPELDERALNREVRNTNDAFADAASDIDMQTNLAGGGSGGGGGIATAQNAMLGLAEQRNNLLEELNETLDEDFVGSSQDEGSTVGSGLRVIGMGSVATTIASALSGAVGTALAGVGGAVTGTLQGAGIVGLIQAETDFFQRVESAGASLSDALGSINTKRLLGALNLSSLGLPQIIASAGAGLVEGFRGEGLFNIEQAKQGFNEVFQTYNEANSQVISDLQNFFSGLSWPSTPDWMDPFTNWSWPETPSWMNPFTEWDLPEAPNWVNTIAQWSWPQAPQWISDIMQLFGVGGPPPSQTRPVIEGTPDDQRDPTLARESRQNQAQDGRTQANVNTDVTLNVDPQRVSRELLPEVERMIQQGLDDIRQDLERGGASGTAPGAR